MEYVFTSDMWVLPEDYQRTVVMEDNDIAHVDSTGSLTIDRILKDGASTKNSLKFIDLQKERMEKRMREYGSFMRKEIFEQPEAVVNTMRGRVNFKNYEIKFGGFQVRDGTLH